MSEPLMIRGRPPRSTAVALLQAQGLPISDITAEHLEHFFFVGLELYGADALLRSLVVAEDARGKGLGSTLIDHAEQYATSKGVRSIYLLTTTAEGFFKRLGYERTERSNAPPSIGTNARVCGPLPSALGVHGQANLNR